MVDNAYSIAAALREEPYAFQQLVGFEVTGWSEGFAQVELELGEKHGNRYGIPHGGLHATLIDTAMGFCGSYTGDPTNRQLVMTLSMTVNYLGQVQGNRLIATARRTGGGRSTYFAEALIRDDLGNDIASGVGTFRLRGKKN
ncbi:PaaI family thioesterase [Thalassobius sp. Cn5-15]|jgi:uncharacterized protein (TIGR00369 family)|uniref:PaaI family thioesterase n=1 Tax=Thalassobius sp. Cn5-15 TaxID=2917763 RepID=UPI001EF2C77D|nr:PaaI family thioesterase [Thalassobius sp. Cn5-15]MCG7494605.1 PaaI family thioesterase [Thalassobius sp. Cn5-15]